MKETQTEIAGQEAKRVNLEKEQAELQKEYEAIILKIADSGYAAMEKDLESLNEALERLQQILFFKELDFKLKEIKEILRTPDFDKLSAYRNQKKLLTLKRDRLDKLIALLEKLERGEPYMNFEAFNLNEYIDALEQFKRENAEEVVKYWGSVEDFDQFISRVRDDQDNVARLAVKQFGSVEKYTEAMKRNLAHFP